MGIPKVIVLTDVGRDVDDVQALNCLEAAEQRGLLEVVGIVATHMLPDVRSRIARLIAQKFGRKIPVGSGSTFPLGREYEQHLLKQYLEEHKIGNHSYEGLGLDGFNYGFAMFRKSEEVILNAIIENPGEVYIFVLAPFTDLAKAILCNISVFEKGGIQGIYVQGNASVESFSKLTPDEVAYNVKEDVWAAEIVMSKLEGIIPFTFLGKWAAYEAPLTEADFQKFADTGHPVGKYLLETAKNGLRCFAERMPELFSKLYAQGRPVDKNNSLANVTHLSNPYDPSTILALIRPELFKGNKVGKHTFIGQEKSNPGVVCPIKLKEAIMEEILYSLNHSADVLEYLNMGTGTFG